ncbi:MAG TPA: hypothetical protein ENG11_01490 [candidate division Zixibacteria bacterium]|nr:hypothetical protein [candidate division Zixibacteria bacterium]
MILGTPAPRCEDGVYGIKNLPNHPRNLSVSAGSPPDFQRNPSDGTRNPHISSEICRMGREIRQISNPVRIFVLTAVPVFTA